MAAENTMSAEELAAWHQRLVNAGSDSKRLRLLKELDECLTMTAKRTRSKPSEPDGGVVIGSATHILALAAELAAVQQDLAHVKGRVAELERETAVPRPPYPYPPYAPYAPYPYPYPGTVWSDVTGQPR